MRSSYPYVKRGSTERGVSGGGAGVSPVLLPLGLATTGEKSQRPARRLPHYLNSSGFEENVWALTATN